MQISEKGLALIKEFEGCKLTAYLCPANVWTIGYGHTRGVKKGDIITQSTADKLLVDDVAVSELTVNSAIKRQMIQSQFDAMVSLAFNIGGGNFAQSTLVKKFNAGDAQGAADQFPRWKFANGEEMLGLIRRRAAERELFLL